eukprot:scaffold149_cov383-Prasinococcus_capsulatus_cf.AAC.11
MTSEASGALQLLLPCLRAIDLLSQQVQLQLLGLPLLLKPAVTGHTAAHHQRRGRRSGEPVDARKAEPRTRTSLATRRAGSQPAGAAAAPPWSSPPTLSYALARAAPAPTSAAASTPAGAAAWPRRPPSAGPCSPIFSHSGPPAPCTSPPSVAAASALASCQRRWSGGCPAPSAGPSLRSRSSPGTRPAWTCSSGRRRGRPGREEARTTPRRRLQRSRHASSRRRSRAGRQGPASSLRPRRTRGGRGPCGSSQLVCAGRSWRPPSPEQCRPRRPPTCGGEPRREGKRKTGEAGGGVEPRGLGAGTHVYVTWVSAPQRPPPPTVGKAPRLPSPRQGAAWTAPARTHPATRQWRQAPWSAAAPERLGPW